MRCREGSATHAGSARHGNNPSPDTMVPSASQCSCIRFAVSPPWSACTSDEHEVQHDCDSLFGLHRPPDFHAIGQHGSSSSCAPHATRSPDSIDTAGLLLSAATLALAQPLAPRPRSNQVSPSWTRLRHTVTRLLAGRSADEACPEHLHDRAGTQSCMAADSRGAQDGPAAEGGGSRRVTARRNATTRHCAPSRSSRALRKKERHVLAALAEPFRNPGVVRRHGRVVLTHGWDAQAGRMTSLAWPA
jgi:hypothetical protein